MPIFPKTLPNLSRLSDSNLGYAVQLPSPISNIPIKLDSFSLSGFFGGGHSVVAMASSKLIPGHRWCGWYNTPGSLEMARQYGPLSGLTLLDALFPGGQPDPTRFLQLDFKTRMGPKFVGVDKKRTVNHTGHLARLITRYADRIQVDPNNVIPGRSPLRGSQRPAIAIINLQDGPDEPSISKSPLPRSWKTWLVVVPILTSIGASVMCALVMDWYCFTSIVWGIIAHGFACYTIGSGELTFQFSRDPHPEMRRGDGVLKGHDTLVVLIGKERWVDVFTCGSFHLKYGADKKTTGAAKTGDSENRSSCMDLPNGSRYLSRYVHPPQSLIGYSAIFLMGQFVVQLLLIPLGTLFGQLMFIATIIVSWMYNVYLSSITREEIQTKILLDSLKLGDDKIRKYSFTTWTATVAFASFELASHTGHTSQTYLKDFLDAMLPAKGPVWREWKHKMLENIGTYFNPKSGTGRRTATLGANPEEVRFSGARSEHSDDLLGNLLTDAQNAWDAWYGVHNKSPSEPQTRES